MRPNFEMSPYYDHKEKLSKNPLTFGEKDYKVPGFLNGPNPERYEAYISSKEYLHFKKD